MRGTIHALSKLILPLISLGFLHVVIACAWATRGAQLYAGSVGFRSAAPARRGRDARRARVSRVARRMLCQGTVRLTLQAGGRDNQEQEENIMDFLNDIFASIWSLLNETLGHQVANMFNALLWNIGVYTD